MSEDSSPQFSDYTRRERGCIAGFFTTLCRAPSFLWIAHSARWFKDCISKPSRPRRRWLGPSSVGACGNQRWRGCRSCLMSLSGGIKPAANSEAVLFPCTSFPWPQSCQVSVISCNFAFSSHWPLCPEGYWLRLVLFGEWIMLKTVPT